MSGLDSPASEPAAPPGEFAPPPYMDITQGFPSPFEQMVVGRRYTPQSDPGGTEAAGPAAAAAFGSSSATVFPSTSADLLRPIRLLNFEIEYRDRNVELSLPDSESVGT